MEDVNLSDSRKQEIIESLKKERQKRKELLEQGTSLQIDNSDLTESNSSAYRSQTINKLLKERRDSSQTADNMLKSAKKQLQDSILKQRQTRDLLNTSAKASPSNEPPKPQKRQVKKPQPRPSSAPSKKKPEIPSYNFKPQITPLPSGKQFNYKTTELWEDKDQRLDELAKSKTEAYKRRESAKKQKELLEQKECTFRPKVSEHPSNRPFQNEPVEERLMKMGKEKDITLQKLLRKKEESEIAEHTFHPQVSVKTTEKKPPIYKRIEEIQQEKEAERHKVIQEYEEQSSLTFRPRINPSSKKIAKSKVHSKPKEKNLDLLKEELQKYPFAPQVTYSGEPNLEEFISRQEEFLNKKTLNQQEIRKKWAEHEKCTFSPVLNPHSQKLASKTLDTFPDRLEKLSKLDYEKAEKKKAEIQENYYSKFKFEPKINPTSRVMAKHSSKKELSYTPSKLAKESVSMPTQVDEDYSFQPSTYKSTKYADVQSKYSSPSTILNDILSYQKSKQEKITSQKQISESQKLKGCTFTPKVNKKKPQEDKPVVVAGLNRYLELRDMLKMQEQELKLRQEKVFNLKPKGGHYQTVPEPFNISNTDKTQKTQKLKEELLQEEMKECTFKPQTLET